MQARATRGVHKGTWYFEIKVTHLGPTGHCRLGWSTKKGELQVHLLLCQGKIVRKLQLHNGHDRCASWDAWDGRGC